MHVLNHQFYKATRTKIELEDKFNMRVHLQNDASADGFAKQLLEIVNGKLAIDEATQWHYVANKFL